MNEISDTQLVIRCLAGRSDNCAEIYHRFGSKVKVYLLRTGFVQSDSDDLVQEIFMRVFNKLEQFDPEKGKLGQWIFAITKNCVRKAWSKRENHESFDKELAESLFVDEADLSGQIQTNEEIQLLHAAINSLDQDQQVLVQLRFITGLTTRAIADKTGLAESSVRYKLDKIFEILASKLEEIKI